MVSSIIAHLTIFAITVVLGGLFYILRHDYREAKRKEEDEKYAKEIDESVKSKHSLVAAANARNKRNRVRE